MKKIISLSTFAALTSIIYFSCTKEVQGRTDNLPALNPVSQDLNAGTWKTVLLSSPDAFAVVAPPATNSE